MVEVGLVRVGAAHFLLAPQCLVPPVQFLQHQQLHPCPIDPCHLNNVMELLRPRSELQRAADSFHQSPPPPLHSVPPLVGVPPQVGVVVSILFKWEGEICEVDSPIETPRVGVQST